MNSSSHMMSFGGTDDYVSGGSPSLHPNFSELSSLDEIPLGGFFPNEHELGREALFSANTNFSMAPAIIVHSPSSQDSTYTESQNALPAFANYAPRNWMHQAHASSPHHLAPMYPSPSLSVGTLDSSDDNSSLPPTPHSTWLMDPSSSPAIHLHEIAPHSPRGQVGSDNVLRAARTRQKRPHKWFCEVHGCQRGFTTYQNLRNHINFHNKHRPFSCEEPGCGKHYSTKSDLKRHAKRKHPYA